MDNKTAGFSLMEMLVSIVIGMIIVAAASTMLVNILKAQKDITSSARLNQELGTVMAVMSNEIRRAGFSVCSERVPITFTCPEPPLFYDELGEDIKIDSGGDCIEYRYNADLDNDLDTSGEHRGIRFNSIKNTVQMGGISKNVTCADALDSTDWNDLTDPDVINITSLSFSTTGSKCRNMTKNIYWTVGGGETGLACAAGTGLDSDGCVDLNNTPIAECKTTDTVVMGTTIWVNDDPTVSDYPLYTLFGVNKIRITMQAELMRDSAVSKSLQTSVKVANPWIQFASP